MTEAVRANPACKITLGMKIDNESKCIEIFNSNPVTNMYSKFNEICCIKGAIKKLTA